MRSAAKVGLLVVVFIALLIGGYAALGRSLFGTRTATYYAEFPDAAGVSRGTQVLMSGIKIGSVTKLALRDPRTARVTFEIEEQIRIPVGSQAVLPSSLIGLGESPITIEVPAQLSGSLPPGSTLVGRKASPLDSILPNAKDTVAELTRTIVAIRKLLEDDKLKGRASDLMLSADKTLSKFGDLAGTTNSLLVQNQRQINQALVAATSAIKDVGRVTTQVAKMMEEGKIQRNALAITDDLKRITGNADKLVTTADKLVASMNSLVNDPTLRGPASQTAANIAEISETGKAIATNTKLITENGITISKNAAIISEKAITLTDQANVIAAKAIEIEEQLQGVLERVGGFFTRRSGPGPLSKAGFSMDLMRESNPNYWRTDLGITFPTADGSIHGGIYDAFGSNRITLQMGKQVGPNFGYRYGIYAAKPGVGVDYQVSPRLSLRGDAWDINRLRLDLRARYDFGNGFHGWLGVDSLLNRNAPTIGIGIRR